MIRIKGSVILARRVFVEKHFGEDAWRRLLAAMSDDDRQELDGGRVLDVGWYPFELGSRLDAAIVGELGGGKPDVFLRIGAESARENLAGVHRSFLKPGNPRAFLALAPAIYRMYYDTGRRIYESTGPTSGVLTTYDAETFSRPDCLTVVGWYREALEMCGAEAMSVQEETCRAEGGDHCRYRVSWQPPPE